jgi:hypothetical protein
MSGSDIITEGALFLVSFLVCFPVCGLLLSAAICLPLFAFVVECNVCICRLTSIRTCGRTSCWRTPCACRSPSHQDSEEASPNPYRSACNNKILMAGHLAMAQYGGVHAWNRKCDTSFFRSIPYILYHVWPLLVFPKSTPRTRDTTWYMIIRLAQSHSTAV